MRLWLPYGRLPSEERSLRKKKYGGHSSQFFVISPTTWIRHQLGPKTFSLKKIMYFVSIYPLMWFSFCLISVLPTKLWAPQRKELGPFFLWRIPNARDDALHIEAPQNTYWMSKWINGWMNHQIYSQVLQRISAQTWRALWAERGDLGCITLKLSEHPLHPRLCGKRIA